MKGKILHPARGRPFPAIGQVSLQQAQVAQVQLDSSLPSVGPAEPAVTSQVWRSFGDNSPANGNNGFSWFPSGANWISSTGV